MKRKTPTIFNVGISSILTIFILLSLVSFATLALVTARSDAMLSQKYADRVRTYYAAHNEAVKKWNALNARPEGAEVSYQVPIGETQQLCVTLTYSEADGAYAATRWQTQNIRKWESDDSMPLYRAQTSEQGSAQ